MKAQFIMLKGRGPLFLNKPVSTLKIPLRCLDRKKNLILYVDVFNFFGGFTNDWLQKILTFDRCICDVFWTRNYFLPQLDECNNPQNMPPVHPFLPALIESFQISLKSNRKVEKILSAKSIKINSFSQNFYDYCKREEHQSKN